MTTDGNTEERRISGFGNGAKPVDSLRFPHGPLGQNYPQDYPQVRDALGEPLGIREAAGILGCSTWTVRHRYLPQGLPHFRSGPLGKLIFFRNQVVQWILREQRKGDY
ncbi:MAG: hypothetical protein ACP5E2_13450 [Terracidiphilus sp.]